MQKRRSYFFLIILVIIAGLISRKIHGIPLWIGDAMYAMMMYFILRFILIRKRAMVAAFASLSICFIIEFTQLYRPK